MLKKKLETPWRQLMLVVCLEYVPLGILIQTPSNLSLKRVYTVHTHHNILILLKVISVISKIS